MEKVHPSSVQPAAGGPPPHKPATDKDAVERLGGPSEVSPKTAAPRMHLYEEETLLRPSIDQFTEAEVSSFVHLSEFARPNPRKIMRITNTYILARLLLPPDAELRYKTLAWIMLCEQWPVRVAWILQVIKDNQQLVGEASADSSESPLYEYYLANVEKMVFSSMTGEQIKNPHVRKQYVDAYAMDFDPDLFEVFLRKVNLKVSDVGELRVERPRSKLSSYTISLSPGILALIARIASHRVKEDTLKRLMNKDYKSITVVGDNDYRKRKSMNSLGGFFVSVAGSERASRDQRDRVVQTNTRSNEHVVMHGHQELRQSFRAQALGKDFVNYSEYAQAISQLVVNLVATPCVFGLSGVWGIGKSFTMIKILTYIQACSLSQLVHLHGQDDEHYGLLQEIAVLAGDDNSMKLLYKWLMTGADFDAIGTGKFPALDKSVVNNKWIAYKASVGQRTSDEDFDVIGFFAHVFALLGYLVSAARWAWRSLCTRAPDNAPLLLLRKVWLETKTQGEKGVNYEFVWFNAWTFCSGSESLWAGLVLKLHEGVEKHFGPTYAHAEYRARMLIASVKILMAVLFALIGVILLGPNDWASMTMELENMMEDANTFIYDLMQKFTGISVLGFSLSTWARQGFKLFETPSTPSRSLRERASKFKGRLGFMDEVRKEIEFLARILNHPKDMPTFWDLIVPDGWVLLGSFVDQVKRLVWKPPNKSPRKCRIVLCVDDLDRCPPDKIMEVLQALVLINHKTPFITFLASDPRILVNAVETNYKGFYRESGVTGYEYIEKMIQVPFSFPPLSEYDKSKLFRGFLTGTAEVDHLEFLDLDEVFCRYELNKDLSGVTVTMTGRVLEKDCHAPCKVIRYARGVLYNGHRSSRLPFSIAESLLRQLVRLAQRCDPPVPVELGNEPAHDEPAPDGSPRGKQSPHEAQAHTEPPHKEPPRGEPPRDEPPRDEPPRDEPPLAQSPHPPPSPASAWGEAEFA